MLLNFVETIPGNVIKKLRYC